MEWDEVKHHHLVEYPIRILSISLMLWHSDLRFIYQHSIHSSIYNRPQTTPARRGVTASKPFGLFLYSSPTFPTTQG